MRGVPALLRRSPWISSSLEKGGEETVEVGLGGGCGKQSRFNNLRVGFVDFAFLSSFNFLFGWV